MTTRRLGIYLAVALIAGACAPVVGPATAEPLVVQPTPRIVYVTPAPSLAPLPTIERPNIVIALGEIARLGDWDVAVGEPDFDAWTTLKAESQVNEKPPDDTLAVLIPIRAIYRGEGQAYLNPAQHFQVLGEGTNVKREMWRDYARIEPACDVVPDDLWLDNPTVNTGGRVAGNLCFVVDKTDVASLVLLWSADEYGFVGEFTIMSLRPWSDIEPNLDDLMADICEAFSGVGVSAIMTTDLFSDIYVAGLADEKADDLLALMSGAAAAAAAGSTLLDTLPDFPELRQMGAAYASILASRRPFLDGDHSPFLAALDDLVVASSALDAECVASEP